MSDSVSIQPNPTMRPIIEISVRLLVIGIFLFWSFLIISPFVNPIIWASVIAVAIYPVFLKISGWMGGRAKLAVALLTLLALALILIPGLMMASSLLHSAQNLAEQVTQGTLDVPPPPEKVKDWPVVGDRLHGAWLQASENLEIFLARYQTQLQNLGSQVLSSVAGAGAGILNLILAILIASFFLLKADSCTTGMTRLANRLAGQERGSSIITLSAATVRSVAVGVLGVAFIQAVLAGIGLMFAGVPAAGIWALIVLFLAIVQLPPALVLLPIAIWVFGSTDSQFTAWAFLIYSLLVSISDSFLKPMLLGRGVDVPMIVILLGAIGGMIHSGIIGLFVGAVVLALGYRLLMVWLEMEDPKETPDPA